MDVRTLMQLSDLEHNESEPILATKTFLPALVWLIRNDDVHHIGKALTKHYNWDWDSDVREMVFACLTSGGSVSAITELVRRQVPLIARVPKIVEGFGDISRFVDTAFQQSIGIAGDVDTVNSTITDIYRLAVISSFQYFSIMISITPKPSSAMKRSMATRGALDMILDKHITLLGPSDATAHLQCLSGILQVCTAFESDSPIAKQLIDGHREDHPATSHDSLFIMLDWKFGVLKRLLVSTQMQLRIVAVSTMCSDLLSIYGARRNKDSFYPEENPVLLYVANIIIDLKVIDYLVGVGSHPEIIGESGNIVGFLVATKTYTSRQTDMIWETVATSQDPRMVEAILRMTAVFLNLMDYSQLLHFCSKLGALPQEAFTAAMRDFCTRILHVLIVNGTSQDNGHQHLDSAPYDLFVNLIRQSSAPTPENCMGSPDIQKFALLRLHELLPHGPTLEARKEMYLSCIGDISEKSPTSSGSICALVTLLRPHMALDLHMLTTKHDLTRLVIEELEHTSAKDFKVSDLSLVNVPAQQARRDLLQSIIILEPSSISPMLGERLWNLLVGPEARSSNDRDTAWQLLINAAKRTPAGNSFLASCFQIYLPKLDREFYTIGALDFAREAVNISVIGSKEEPQTLYYDPVEEIWRIVLTALPGTIETAAIISLVEIHIDDLVLSVLPRADQGKGHLALVQRCLKQMSVAAEKIKNFQDNLIGDGEPMTILNPDSHYLEQESIFTRSLLVLREFLRIHQSKPQPSTPNVLAADNTISTNIVGDSITVRYQTCGGRDETPVETLEIGRDNSFGSFLAIVREATGNEHFRMFFLGKEFIQSNALLSSSVGSLQLDRNVVLLRPSKEANIESVSTPSNLEKEIILHFDELWGYLGMEAKLAREVSAVISLFEFS